MPASYQAEPVEDLRAMNGATPKSRSPAGYAAKIVPHGEQVPHTAVSHASGPSGGYTGAAPTPFYDQLMSMIHSTALENRCAAQHHDVGDAASHAARPRWRIHPLIPCVVALIVVAAGGRFLLGPEPSQRQPPVVTAEPEGRRVPVAETDGAERGGLEGRQTAEGGIGVESLAAAKKDARPADADQMAIANPKSEQPPPADAPSPIETGSIKRADDPPATRMARVASDVNMRAGPSNGQTVLATISRGSSVEVIDCRQWCEVVFAGQRGWIYRGFIVGN